MLDFLVSLLETNINFQTVGAFLIAYFLAIWLLFCLWVFIDAKKRFESNIKAGVFFVLVVVLNFPALIFYLIIRPDKNEDHFLYLQNNEVVSQSDSKGIDVPIINFVGENGEVNLTFQLRVNKAIGVNTIQTPEVNILSNNEAKPEILQVNVDMPKVNNLELPAGDKPQITQVKKEEVTVVQQGNGAEQGVAKSSFYSVKTSVSSNFSKLKSSFSRKLTAPSEKTVTVINAQSTLEKPAEKSVNSGTNLQKKQNKDKKKLKHRRR